MGLPDVRDPRGFEKRIGSMDAERLAAAVQDGGLSPVAERAAMAELAGRVLADEIDCNARAQGGIDRVVNWVTALVAVAVLGAWLARTLGLL
jgi:hypothetical protein